MENVRVPVITINSDMTMSILNGIKIKIQQYQYFINNTVIQDRMNS